MRDYEQFSEAFLCTWAQPSIVWLAIFAVLGGIATAVFA